MEVFEYYKSFEHKISKGKYTRFFLRLAGIAVIYFTERFICLACEICLSKTIISYITDRVERIVGSTSNSSELNDSGDQAADSQRQEAEETIPESSTSRYGRKRTLVPPRKTMCYGIIYMYKCNLVLIIKHQIKSK